MSFKKIFLALCITSLIAHDQSSLQEQKFAMRDQDYLEHGLVIHNHDFLQELAKKIPHFSSFKELTTFIQNNRTRLYEQCYELKVIVDIWHDDTCNEKTWQQVQQYFLDIETTEDTEDSPQRTQIINLLGEPFKTMLESETSHHNGISYNFDFEYDDEKAIDDNPQDYKLFINVAQCISIHNDFDDDLDSILPEDILLSSTNGKVIWAKDPYDKKAWQHIFDAFFDFAKKFTSGADPYDLLKHCCPRLEKIIASSRDNSGVHFNIDVLMYDYVDKIDLGCTNHPKKDDSKKLAVEEEEICKPIATCEDCTNLHE